MLKTLHTLMSGETGGASGSVWRKPALVGAFLVVLFAGGSGLAGRALADVDSATEPSASNDVIDKTVRLREAYARLDKLEDEVRSSFANGEFDMAAEQCCSAAEFARSEFGADHWLTKQHEAVAAGVRALAKLPEGQRQQFRDVGKAQSLANFLQSQGKKERALNKLREIPANWRQQAGPENVVAAYQLLQISVVELDINENTSAKEHAEEARRVIESQLGNKSPMYATAIFVQGVAEYCLEELEAAERHLKEVAGILRPAQLTVLVASNLQFYGRSQLVLARLLNDQKRYAEAEVVARSAADTFGLLGTEKKAQLPVAQAQLEVARSASGQGNHEVADRIFAFLIWPNLPTPQVAIQVFTAYSEHLRRVSRLDEAEQIDRRIEKISAQSTKTVSNGDQTPR